MRYWVAFLITLTLIQEARGADRYWVGSAGGNWSSSSNWSASANPCGVGGGASVPGSGDYVNFTSCNNNVTVDTNIVVDVLTFIGYTGTISFSGSRSLQATVSLNTDATDMDLSGFSSIDVGSLSFTTSGTVTLPSGIITVRGPIFSDGAIINPNSGTVRMVIPSDSDTFPTIGDVFELDFHNLEITLASKTWAPDCSDATNYNISFSIYSNLNIGGNLTISNPTSKCNSTDGIITLVFSSFSSAILTVDGLTSFPNNAPADNPITFGTAGDFTVNTDSYSLADANVTVGAIINVTGVSGPAVGSLGLCGVGK